MLGFLFGEKKVQKVNLTAIAETLSRRDYEFEVDREKNLIKIHHRYRNDNRQVRDWLYLYFLGGEVRMQDAFGQVMAKNVPVEKMYPVMKNILGLV